MTKYSEALLVNSAGRALLEISMRRTITGRVVRRAQSRIVFDGRRHPRLSLQVEVDWIEGREWLHVDPPLEFEADVTRRDAEHQALSMAAILYGGIRLRGP